MSKLLAKSREPGILASMVEGEASRLLEAGSGDIVLPRVRTKAFKVDIGRSMFYMVAIDELYSHVQNHPLTPEIVARERAAIQAERDRMTDEEREEAERQAKQGTRLPYVTLPLPADVFSIALDEERFTKACAIGLVHHHNVGQVMLDAATHYFESRAAGAESPNL